MKLPTLATILLTAVALSAADAPKSVYDVSLKDIGGKDTSLKDYQGKVTLYFVEQNSLITSLVPGSWPPKSLQGKPRTASPSLLNS